MRRSALLVLPLLAGCDVRVKRAADSPRADSIAPPAGTTTGVARVDTPLAPPRIVRHDVIVRGSHGMTARVRWLLSPDRLTLLVTEDPSSVEADPLPNGIIVASERRSALVHIDEVWDAAPSPDWRWLAYGKAFVLRGEHRDTVAAKRWGPLAQRLAEIAAGGDGAGVAARRRQLERDLATRSFPVSGMAITYGAASTHLLRLDSLPLGARDLVDTLPPTHLGGWRVRWRRGDTLAIGTRPARSQDDAPAARWELVVPVGTDSLSATIAVVTDTTRLAPLFWAEGPTLDIASAVDLSAEKTIDAGAARIVSRGGTIFLTRPGDATPVPVGPGLPLAATTNGRYIVAIAPHTDRREHESPTITVVYEVIPQ
jgi:hypothetical protein